MCTNSNNDNRYSFFQLFKGKSSESDNKYKIVIPIIQRDYAQGRKSDSVEDVRTDFLQKLKEYISDPNQTSHDLDFVYGYKEPIPNSPYSKFIPLDGQQRLTTLFLLHWYLAQRTTNANDKDLFINNLSDSSKCKSLFSYETRSSATDFCDCLIQASVDWENLETVTVDKKEVPSLSSTIRNMYWFAPSWMQDPTVQSMLVMLETIHSYFDDEDYTTYLDRLLTDTNPAVTFIFMDLDDNGLTDDLYIKMNSRGKPLTPFENFKARFEQYIGDIDPALFSCSNSEMRDVIIDKNNTINNPKQYFSFNIDTKWTNLMWAYCREELTQSVSQDDIEKRLESLLDKKLANFIRVILANQLPIDLKSTPQYPANATKEDKNAIDEEDKNKKSKQHELLNILVTDNNRLYISYNTYEKNYGLSPDAINYLISAFDVLTNGQNKIATYLNNCPYYDEEEVFKFVINNPNNLTYRLRIRFHAYVKYLIKFKNHPDFSSDFLNNWMHFIYNITIPENTITDSTKDFENAIGSINNLLQKMSSPSIYDHLKSVKSVFKMDYFSDWQVQEEQIKAHLFSKSSDWNDLLLDLEKHEYLRHQIGFVLEFAGIVDYFNINYNCNWTQTDDSDFLNKVKKYGAIAKEVFGPDYENRKYASDSIFERAMLVKYPDYVKTPKSERFNLLSSCAGGNVKRDFSWRVLLRITNEKIRRSAVKEMFDYLVDENNIHDKLEDYINNNISSMTPSLVKAFSMHPQTVLFCKNGHFDILNNGCFLKRGTNPSYNDAEIYTYTLYNENNSEININDKFNIKEEHYYYARSENRPHIYWHFKYENQEYSFGIYAVAPKGDFKKYQFIIRNVHSLPTGMPKKLIGKIEQIGFQQNSAQSDYYEFMMDVNDVSGTQITDFSDTKVIEKFHEIKEKIKNSVDSLSQPIV